MAAFMWSREPEKGSQDPSTRTLAQVRLLMEHLSALQDRHLSELEISYGYNRLKGAVLLERIFQIIGKCAKSNQELTTEDYVVLQLTRDALSAAIAPATGKTVAYTALVMGPLSAHKTNRTTFASDGYPNLKTPARWHKASRLVFLLLAILLTWTVVGLSTEVAVGKHLLQTVGDLRARQATIAQEEQQIEAALGKLEGRSANFPDFAHGIPVSTVRLCDRTFLYSLGAHQKHASIPRNADGEEVQLRVPGESAVCGQDETLRKDFQIAHQDIHTWLWNWPSLVGGPIGWIFSEMAEGHPPEADTSTELQLTSVSWPYLSKDMQLGTEYILKSKNLSGVTDNVELHVAPRILAVGNYLLPVVFGVIGSLIYVLMEFSAKVKYNLLEPRDGWLSWVRLVLGLAVGTCIGLFFTAYEPAGAHETSAATGSDLISSLTLSASGLAFLAGFGVEGVFNMLQELVRRVFPAERELAGEPNRLARRSNP